MHKTYILSNKEIEKYYKSTFTWDYYFVIHKTLKTEKYLEKFGFDNEENYKLFNMKNPEHEKYRLINSVNAITILKDRFNA